MKSTFEKLRLCSLVLPLLMLGLTVAPLTSSAQTIIDTYPDWNGDITNGWRGTAQTITGFDEWLVNYRFALADRVGAGSLNFSVFEWGATGPTGAALFSQNIAWSAGGDVDITGINVHLAAGTLYGMAIDLQGYTGGSVHYNTNRNSYTGGNGWWTQDVNGNWNNFSSLNHKFRAEFSDVAPVPEPASALLLLIVGAGAAGVRRFRRRS